MLSVSESAEILGVSPARVRQLIAAGSLEAKKAGRAWVVPEAAVYNRLSRGPQPGRPRLTGDHAVEQSSTGTDEESLRSLYLQCKESFSFRPSLDVISAAQTQEEANFYMAVSDFFLREKQWELVKRGVY